MNYNYKKLIKDELSNNFSNWSFSKEMQNASRNASWKNKKGLWTLLSGACDEAALECYEHINKFSKELIDIDTCNIYSLRSIAKSVDLEYLCNHIKEDSFPNDVLKLINLFSIPKYYLMNKNDILCEESNDQLMGNILKRTSLINEDSVAIDTISNIKKYSIHIKNILNANMIFTRKSLKDLLKSDLKDLKLTDDNYILNISLNNIFDSINNIDLEKYKLILFKKQQLYINDDETEINYFYLLINVIKQNLYNEKYDFFIVPKYFNKELNETINLRWLFIDIVNTLSVNNEYYIKDFICFHFYNLLSSKIKNEKLKSMYFYDNKNKIFIVNNNLYKEYEKEIFISLIKDIIDENDIEYFFNTLNNYLNKDDNPAININYNYEMIEFITYIKYINSFVNKYDITIKNKKLTKIDYDLIKINFPEFFDENYENILYGNTIDNISKFEGVLMKIAKELTNISLNISYIRKQIKTSILQYNFIGTKRIATDIFTDFFLKNYTNENEWNYISDKSVLNKDLNEGEFFKPLSTLLNNDDNKFSIDIVEYYDTTKYLNIKSELGSSYMGSYISRIDTEPKYFLDSNNLITSSIISSNVYENTYIPCSYFLKDYNEQFWKNTDFINIEINNTNKLLENEYNDFYGQYIPEYDKNLTSDNKKYELNEELTSLFNNIWNTFSLSSYDETDSSDTHLIRKKYIGNEFGSDRFKNLKNKYFPTIAPVQNIKGLIRTSDFDKYDILYLAKIYYTNTVENVIYYTNKMLHMYDNSGVPFDNWKKNYVDFHGYSTCYESSDNTCTLSVIPKKYFGFDGPWSYSLLQKIIYDRLNNEENYDYLTKFIDIEDEEKFPINEMYKYYIYDRNIFLNNQFKISNIETDIFDNTFTLFENKEKQNGTIYFRTYDMPISIPLASDVIEYNMFNFNNNSNDLMNDFSYLFKNCIRFGIAADLMWIFSNSKNNKYKLVTFKYNIKYNRLFIDESSIKYYGFTNSFINETINSINDLIGVDYNINDEYLNIFIFDSFKILNEFADSYGSKLKKDLFKFNMPITHFKLNIFNNLLKTSIIYVDNAVFPSILNHDVSNKLLTVFKNEIFDESHSVWKLEKFNNRYYICYEALNYLESLKNKNAFDYYYSFYKKCIYFEDIIFEYSSYNGYTEYDNFNNGIKNKFQYMKIYYSDFIEKFMYNPTTNDNELFSKIFEYSLTYPKKYTKNGTNYISIIPLSIFNIFKKFNIMNDIYKNIINLFNYFNNEIISFKFIYDNFDKIFYNIYIDSKEYKEYDECKQKTKKQINFIVNKLKINKEHLYNVKMCFDSRQQDIKILNNLIDKDYYLINEIFEYIPIIKQCFSNNLKITVWFKNNSNIKFINNEANDLDLTCYINDDYEKHKKVGYWNGYKRTKYIEWSGDNTIGENELINVNVPLYISDKYNSYIDKKYKNENLQIVLNTCWYNESEMKNQNVYASINYNDIIQNIDLKLNGINFKSCNDKSIVFNINMKSENLTYEFSKIYFAFKFTLKDKINGYSDFSPDIQVGTINLTDTEFNNLTSNEKWHNFDNFSIYKNDKKNKDDKNKLNYNYITILMKEGYQFVIDDVNIELLILSKLNEYIIYSNLDKNISLNYKNICLNEIYFGYYHNNIDNETGINYIYSSFIKPDSSYSKLNRLDYKYQIFNLINNKFLKEIKSVLYMETYEK